MNLVFESPTFISMEGVKFVFLFPMFFTISQMILFPLILKNDTPRYYMIYMNDKELVILLHEFFCK